jgi:hypothetical protein
MYLGPSAPLREPYVSAEREFGAMLNPEISRVHGVARLRPRERRMSWLYAWRSREGAFLRTCRFARRAAQREQRMGRQTGGA